MTRTIISHNKETADIVVRFEHKGVITEQSANLKQVIPGSISIFAQMGIEFTEEHQLKALDVFEKRIESFIEEGIITNPSEEPVEYSPPPPVEEEATASKKKTKAKE